ncbi:NADPH-dependent F420 reductase [Streptomyces sp. HM190]|uniref:NADPH-dependent F420 reductase n=1 Tax=Streptomyces sp. HM190 TaxID=2695266 RepID=UPI00135A249F|nr:NADPH-dependent F420 reductase [Streptomyces sp. HM190]
MTEQFKIAVVGGTGPQGRGLAYRFAVAGHTVTIGSRSAERAAETAERIAARLPSGRVDAADNLSAVRGAGIVLLAVPYAGHDALVSELGGELDGRIVISCVNPLGFDEHGPYGLPLERSAAEEAQLLVPRARIVGAFHHLAAASLWAGDAPLAHEDVMVCGDDREAAAVVAGLARAVTGHPGIDVGPLRLARQLEPLTAVLISVNRRHKVRSGIRLEGLPRDPAS